MRRWFQAVVLFSLVLSFVGCSDNTPQAPGPQADVSVEPPKPPPPPPPAMVEETPVEPAVVPAASPELTLPPLPPSYEPPRATTASQPAIALSAGVALPQTGPEGTLMSFSVDYRFTRGKPRSSGYVWVIQRTRGAPARQPVRLAEKGNLPILIMGWRPEQGPFRAHLEDHVGNKLSPSIELR